MCVWRIRWAAPVYPFGAAALLLVTACSHSAGWRAAEGRNPTGGAGPAIAERRQGILLERPGRYDFGWRLQRFATLDDPVMEYTEPALQIASDGVLVERLAFAGSMEGLHIATVHPFGSSSRRRKHGRIRGTISGLWSEDIGEDALTIGPRAVLRLEHALLRGRYRPGHPIDGRKPGMDKAIQNDGGSLFAGPDVVLGSFVRAYRGKANSVAVLDGVRFVDCHNPVRGDGLANPREDWPFDRGKPGLCLIVVRNSRFENCHIPFRAGPGCLILVDRWTTRFRDTKGPLRLEEGDGRVVFSWNIESDWRRAAKRLDKPEMAFLGRLPKRDAPALFHHMR